MTYEQRMIRSLKRTLLSTRENPHAHLVPMEKMNAAARANRRLHLQVQRARLQRMAS